ncbi:glycosyltransferase family 4 protein [Histidinibacterium aquaticum]|uniref:Glycosyltransferase family 4 protein n=1 Tax=Histidinibacterium aquaticum TaxID=2613962 RepID=A0A5J5GPY2_9RHOB|nr:glycosyltransferase family 4 protein [Histidinibacterium aquaticum]KAA9010399.1 glycosyltransferase family 4 protein [Histidinibacterium aquaticum]
MDDAAMAAPSTLCFVSRKWPPAMGGMETYAHELSKALERDMEVLRIVLPGHPDGSVPGPLELIRFGVAAAGRLLFAREPAEVTHVADMASWPLGLCARIRRPGARIVLSAHGTDVSYPARGGPKGRLYGAYLRLGARLLGRATVIANSSATAACASGYGFRDIRVVPLAAEGPETRPGPPSRRLLFSGRLIPLKGCAWFIREVLPHLPEDITLDVAGIASDAGEREALQSPRVRYLSRLERPALWQAYSDALCVVVPNVDTGNGTFEGFGLVATETAAAGGVVLAARHAGLQEAVAEGRTGLLLPPGDVGAWADAIREVADWSPEERKAFIRASQTHCAEHFTWDRVARDTREVYADPAAAGSEWQAAR